MTPAAMTPAIQALGCSQCECSRCGQAHRYLEPNPAAGAPVLVHQHSHGVGWRALDLGILDVNEAA